MREHLDIEGSFRERLNARKQAARDAFFQSLEEEFVAHPKDYLKQFTPHGEEKGFMVDTESGGTTIFSLGHNIMSFQIEEMGSVIEKEMVFYFIDDYILFEDAKYYSNDSFIVEDRKFLIKIFPQFQRGVQ